MNKEWNARERNIRIRLEIRELRESGLLMKEAIGIVAERYYLSEVTVRDVYMTNGGNEETMWQVLLDFWHRRSGDEQIEIV